MKRDHKFVVDNEFRNYLFSVDQTCDTDLENSLKQSGGPRDKLIVAELPDGTQYLADGFRRLEICDRHDLPFDVEIVAVADRQDIFDLMDSLQLMRRNLNGKQLSLVRGRQKRLRRGSRSNDKLDHEAAKDAGVSVRTIYRDAEYAAAVDKLDQSIREIAVAEWAKAQIILLSKLPPDQQISAVKEGIHLYPQRKKSRKPKDSLQAAQERGGKQVAKLENALWDLNNSQKDLVRFNTCKHKAREIGSSIDRWGQDYAS